ncbi:MAG TPA: hypothetical protein VMW75_15890 [Thermoanaerobaculia bacterium]|nr:hypothetical protein [Thermoanaerobaculia bacterium]
MHSFLAGSLWLLGNSLRLGGCRFRLLGRVGLRLPRLRAGLRRLYRLRWLRLVGRLAVWGLLGWRRLWLVRFLVGIHGLMRGIVLLVHDRSHFRFGGG